MKLLVRRNEYHKESGSCGKVRGTQVTAHAGAQPFWSITHAHSSAQNVQQNDLKWKKVIFRQDIISLDAR